MNPIFPELPHQLGVYTLTRLMELRQNSVLYEAQQTHVDRSVVLEVLQPGVSAAEEADFLAQARHRGTAGDIPHVAEVFEFLRSDGIWFLTQELPLGRSLADIAAAGEKLRVLQICCVIEAAAEMYSECADAGLSTLALPPTSIFVEQNGETHFLSVLVEGAGDSTESQMQAIAAALWELCPTEKEQGLGRTVTLLQWLAEGYEGRFLEWREIRETASTIVTQLRENAQPESNKPLHARLRERVNRNPGVQRAREFLRHWGGPLGCAACVIIAMSCMGTLFGLGGPDTSEAAGKSGIFCHQEGKTEQVMRYPVSVQQYADFIREFAALEAEAQQMLLSSIPGSCDNLAPLNWETQRASTDREAAVTGVTYWQALLYAHHRGGDLPTANQIQTVLSTVNGYVEMEWSRSEMAPPLPGLYGDTAYLLVDTQGKPIPVNSREWNSPRCGFRITLPQP